MAEEGRAMPTQPPYPREARIVAVEKGPAGQGDLVSAARRFPDADSLISEHPTEQEALDAKRATKIPISLNLARPEFLCSEQYRASITFLFISAANDSLRYGFFRQRLRHINLYIQRRRKLLRFSTVDF
jgi:hypothetical protein